MYDMQFLIGFIAIVTGLLWLLLQWFGGAYVDSKTAL